MRDRVSRPQNWEGELRVPVLSVGNPYIAQVVEACYPREKEKVLQRVGNPLRGQVSEYLWARADMFATRTANITHIIV